VIKLPLKPTGGGCCAAKSRDGEKRICDKLLIGDARGLVPQCAKVRKKFSASSTSSATGAESGAGVIWSRWPGLCPIKT